MAQTLTRLLVHIIFSTKDRKNLIAPQIETDLHAYLGGICTNHESPALAIGGVENHVHLLVSLSKNQALSEFLMMLKRDSSNWIKTRGREYESFYWQDGYGAFSKGESQVGEVSKYIASQKQRHAAITYEEELESFAKKYGVAYDPRFL